MFISYNYVTTRPATPAQEVSDLLHDSIRTGRRPDRTRRTRSRRARPRSRRADPGTSTRGVLLARLKWGEPMWPNSKIQIDNSAGGVLAHEIGHCLGAPDVYRLGRYNDGIGGGATC